MTGIIFFFTYRWVYNRGGLISREAAGGGGGGKGRGV